MSEDDSYSQEEEELVGGRGSIPERRRPLQQGGMPFIADPPKDNYPKSVTISHLYGMIDRQEIDSLNKFMESSLSLIFTEGDDSLLIKAVYNGSVNCTNYLIDVGVDLDYQAKDGFTALMVCAYAPWNDRINQCAKMLINAGANTKLRDNNGYNVMELAFSKNRVELIKTLINMGVDLDDCRPYGMKPIEYILKTRGDMDSLLSILIERGVGDIDSLGANVPGLIHKLAGKQTPFLQKILEKESNRIKEKHDYKESDCVLRGDIDFNCDWLFQDDDQREGVLILDVEESMDSLLLSVDDNGYTPFYHAIRSRLVENVDLLLDYCSDKFDINRSSLLGPGCSRCTSLEFAICNADLPMIKYLIEQGATLDTNRQPCYINWFFSNRIGSNDDRKILDIIFNILNKDPQWRISDIPVKRIFSSCRCSTLMKSVYIKHSKLVEKMLYEGANVMTKCPSNSCCGSSGIGSWFIRNH